MSDQILATVLTGGLVSQFPTEPWVLAVLSALDESAELWVRLNGWRMRLPVGTLLTMSHCISLGNAGELAAWVETAHFQWLQEQAQPESIFIDVGAATGVITLPMAAAVPGIKILAFEPAKRAEHFLKQAIESNGFCGVQVLPAAISDNDGTAEFLERPVDSSGDWPFLPETSALSGAYDEIPGSERRTVTTLTLDTVCLLHRIYDRH